MLESSLEVVTSAHYSSQKSPKELIVYTRRKKRKKYIAVGLVAEIGSDTSASKVPRGTISFANESLAKQLFDGLVGSSSPRKGSYENLGEGSIWTGDESYYGVL